MWSKGHRWILWVVALGLVAAGVWLVAGRSGDDGRPEVRPDAPGSYGSRGPSGAGAGAPKVASQPSSAPSPGGPSGPAVLAQLQSTDTPEQDAAPLPAWQRPMKRASSDWVDDPRLIERNERVKAELQETEAWFDRHPKMADWDEVGPQRMKRVETHAARLGQRVVSAECRVGVCRLEVEYDPTSKQRARVRPEPRILRHPDGSMMVRLMHESSIRTIFFLMDKTGTRGGSGR